MRFAAFASGAHSAIFGTTNVSELEANIRAVEAGPLPPDLVAAVRAIEVAGLSPTQPRQLEGIYTVNEPMPGQALDDLETPVLLLDLDRFESNVQHMAAYCRDNGKEWRPHSKAHKCPAIAHIELANGACGITCAKLSEAEWMVAHGVPSILLANQIVSPVKFATLARLQHRAEVIAAVDNIAVVEPMAAAAIDEGVRIPVVVEIDIGMKRVGVEPGPPLLALSKAISDQPGLTFRGLMGYEGHRARLLATVGQEKGMLPSTGYM